VAPRAGSGAGSGLAEYTLGPGAVRKASGTLACLDLTLVGRSVFLDALLAGEPVVRLGPRRGLPSTGEQSTARSPLRWRPGCW